MSKYKITLVDCENFDNTITIYINEEHMTMSEDIAAAVGNHEGLSKGQIAKLAKFAESCPGPYMVNFHYYDDNCCKEIYYLQFTFGHIRVYKGSKYMHIIDGTYVQGHRDMAYRIPVEDYKGIDNVRELIERMNFNGECKAGALELVYHGPRVR